MDKKIKTRKADGATSMSHLHTQHPVVKAAIYTRKSSEEGLDLSRVRRTSCATRHSQRPVSEFNSLDAQREACKAYIQSQKHDTCRKQARVAGVLVDKVGGD